MNTATEIKVAIVTGSSRGIGAAIAKRFAKEGCHVAISYAESKEKALLLMKELEKEGVKKYKVDKIKASLEDVFVSLIEDYDREGHAEPKTN